MNPPFTLLVLTAVLGEQAYGLLLTAAKLLPAGADRAAVSLQLAVSGALWLLLLWGARTLWQYRNAARHGFVLTLSPRHACGLLVLLAYALPALPQWWHALQHPHTVSFSQPRYLFAAVCQVLLAVLCLHTLWRQWQLMRRRRFPHAAHTVRLPDR